MHVGAKTFLLQGPQITGDTSRIGRIEHESLVMREEKTYKQDQYINLLVTYKQDQYICLTYKQDQYIHLLVTYKQDQYIHLLVTYKQDQYIHLLVTYKQDQYIRLLVTYKQDQYIRLTYKQDQYMRLLVACAFSSHSLILCRLECACLMNGSCAACSRVFFFIARIFAPNSTDRMS